MVLEQLLPRLQEQGLRTDRLAFHGWSMGGYGALRLAGILGASHVRAVAAVQRRFLDEPRRLTLRLGRRR